MKLFSLVLALVAVSCAPWPEQQSIVLEQHPDRPPEICEVVTTAINRGDWATLRMMTRPMMTASGYITSLENAASAGHPIHIGKLVNSQTVPRMSGPPQIIYSFAIENKNETAIPHSLQIKVRDYRGQLNLVDFWGG
jgi:hypothetical protein